MLNIDVAATAFLEPLPVLRFLCDVLRKPETAITLDDRTELRKAQKAIVGLKASLLRGSSFPNGVLAPLLVHNNLDDSTWRERCCSPV